MLFSGEKSLLFNCSDIMLKYRLGNISRTEAMNLLLTLSKEKGHSDLSLANLAHNAQIIADTNKTAAATAIAIFENIMASPKAGATAKGIIRTALPTLNIPVYMQDRVTVLQSALFGHPAPGRTGGLATKYAVIKPNNNGLATKYAVARPNNNGLATKYAVARPNTNNNRPTIRPEFTSKYGVRGC